MKGLKGFHHIMVAKMEDTYGNVVEPYDTGTLKIPYFKVDINKSIASESEPVIFGDSREISMPIKGQIEVVGSLDIPIDASSIGFWLHYCLGQKEVVLNETKFVPCTTGLPSFYAEFGNDQGSILKRISGVKVNEMKINIEPTGTIKGTVSVVCQDLHLEHNTDFFVLTPENETTYRPFQSYKAQVKVDGIEVGFISEINTTYSNNLDSIRTIGDFGKITDLSEGSFNATGSLKALIDKDFINKSLNQSAVSIETEISQVINEETHALKTVLSKVELSQPKISVDGPNAYVYVDMDFKAYHENGEGTAFYYIVTEPK